MAAAQYYGTGRRKSAVARVYATSGTGKITINKKTIEDYFGRKTDQMVSRQPLECVDLVNKFDINVIVKGGGPSGQAGAVQLGLARALVAADETFKKQLRATNLLTRDPREKERKKPGLKKARKAKQYTKR